MSDMSNIYSPANIARSRSRAASIRAQVADGTLAAEWLDVAAAVEAYATERAAAGVESSRQCSVCNGSGRVAVGPWGSRPARVRCSVCAGKGVVASAATS